MCESRSPRPIDAAHPAPPASATILLHEPFCDRHDQSSNSSLARCLLSAKCVVQSVWAFFGMSNDLAGVDPFVLSAFSPPSLELTLALVSTAFYAFRGQ